MKRLSLLLIVFMLMVSLVACSTSTSSNQNQETGTIAEKVDSASEEPATEAVSTEMQAISPGNFIEKGNYKFSFEKASLYNEVVQSELYTDKPKDGKVFLVCFFEVENMSSESQYVNYLYLNAYVDDYDTDMKALLSDVDGYSQLSGNLQPGKKLKGYVCYEVSPDWEELEITYKDGLVNAEEYNFVVTPGDIT